MLVGEIGLVGASQAPDAMAAIEQSVSERTAYTCAGAGQDDVHVRIIVLNILRAPLHRSGAGLGPCPRPRGHDP